jgi:rod shape determining protein RodA
MSKGVDWTLVGVYLVLVLTGIASIFATTYRDENIITGFLSFKTDYSRQLLYFFLSAVLAVFILLMDSKFFTATSNILYFAGLILLILVFPFHTDVKGTIAACRIVQGICQPCTGKIPFFD